MEHHANYLLIGGGLASANAAAALREHDANGAILLVGGEPMPPYDRPPYSKNFLTDDEMKPEDTLSKPEDFYSENRITLLTGVKATQLDLAARRAQLSNDDSARYDKLLLATGATPATLGVPGENLSGVHFLRNYDDGMKLRDAMRSAKKAVMIGAGFIGMEVASFCRQRDIEVTVVTRGDQLWPQLNGSDALQAFLRGCYEERGVQFLMNQEVKRFEGDSALSAVTLQSGQTLDADLAVVAVGVSLNTDLAKEAGLELGERDAVNVDRFLRTSDPNVYAAGDIARFEDVAMGQQWHIEHYMNAMGQGEAVGAIMAGEEKAFDQVPYFFSDFFDLSMIMRGDPKAGKSVRVFGEMNSGDFVELYADDEGRVRMGIALSHDYEKLEPISEKLEKLIRDGASVDSAVPADYAL